MNEKKSYIPALSFDRLTPFYDPLLRWGMREQAFKHALIQQAEINPGMRVLDLGSGTGTLTILIKQTHPQSVVTGLDGDPKVLQIAQAKAARAGADINFDYGMAFELPYPDSSIDRVLSSLVMHHLTRYDKQRTMNEVYRVLNPGGELHIVDFGKPRGAYGRLASQFIKRMEQAEDNINGLLPVMMGNAGFQNVEEPARYTTVFGTLSFYRGRKSEI
jgi:ubiquinone/menaquinone biosynthesis C-methylase UbiE